MAGQHLDPQADPVVTVWRNRIPHPCTLTYWGCKWRFRDDTTYRRLIDLRRMHMWVVHAPIDGGETIIFETSHRRHLHRRRRCWDNFECYNADGSQLILLGKADAPS